jgi:hypothetical protein
MHVLPIPKVSSKRNRHTHGIRKNAAPGSVVGFGKRETELSAVRIPVEFAARMDIVVVIVNLDRLSFGLFFAKGVSRVSRDSQHDILFPKRVQALVSYRAVASLPGVHPPGTSATFTLVDPRKSLFLVRP